MMRRLIALAAVLGVTLLGACNAADEPAATSSPAPGTPTFNKAFGPHASPSGPATFAFDKWSAENFADRGDPVVELTVIKSATRTRATRPGVTATKCTARIDRVILGVEEDATVDIGCGFATTNEHDLMWLPAKPWSVGTTGTFALTGAAGPDFAIAPFPMTVDEQADTIASSIGCQMDPIPTAEYESRLANAE